MKRKWIAVYLLLLFLPYFFVFYLVRSGYFRAEPPEEAPPGYTVTVYRCESGKTETLPLRDYLWGSVAGEMPASYPDEALKAQAVASYTYLLHRKSTVAAHPGTDFGHAGDICDDPAHCKAFATRAEYIARWGQDWYDAAEQRIAAAVEAVLGVAVFYDGAPANTVFHACSGGRTESAADVWGAEVPYLQNVDSSWDASAKDFQSKTEIPLAEFCETLEIQDAAVGAVTLTAGGSVAEQVIGGTAFSGRRLRELFGLRSTHFTLTVGRDAAVFHVCGYGHQVGMSQYGACALAESGHTYREILSYYYTGVTFQEDYFE